MTKNDTDIARHDERINVLEEFRTETHDDIKAIKAVQLDNAVKLVKYKNNNTMWALTLAAFQAAITTVAVILTGQASTALATLAAILKQII